MNKNSYVFLKYIIITIIIIFFCMDVLCPYESQKTSISCLLGPFPLLVEGNQQQGEETCTWTDVLVTLWNHLPFFF